MDLSLSRNCYCLAARRHARAITRHYEAALRAHGLRATQFSILSALALAGPMTMGKLAALLGLERTTLTRSAAPLAREGWLGAVRSPDARQRRLRLTASGRRKLVSAFPTWKAAQDSAAQKFHPMPPAATRAHR